MIKLISHRGNISGAFPDLENRTEYIDAAISHGYDVEVDVRLIGDKLYLGHDAPQHQVAAQWIMDRSKNLFVHSKNSGAFSLMIEYGMKTFYHVGDPHVSIANTDLIWSHNIGEYTKRSIIPLMSRSDMNSFGSFYELINKNSSSEAEKIYGICSDDVSFIKSLI